MTVDPKTFEKGPGLPDALMSYSLVPAVVMEGRGCALGVRSVCPGRFTFTVINLLTMIQQLGEISLCDRESGFKKKQTNIYIYF